MGISSIQMVLVRHKYGVATAAIFVLALGLRLVRLPFRLNQIAFAYAAYYQPFLEAVSHDGRHLLTHFIGLHPPLYSLVFSGLYALVGAPGPQLLASLVFSCLGVVACVWLAQEGLLETSPQGQGLLRVSERESDRAAIPWAAGALAAVSVYALHYALEVNNYPLLFLVSAGCQWAFVRYWLRRNPRNLSVFGGMAVLAVYTHILAGLLVTLQLLTLGLEAVRASLAVPPGTRAFGRRSLLELIQASLLVFLLALPLLKPVLDLSGRGSTYHNTVEDGHNVALEILRTLGARFGSSPVLVLFGLAVVLGLVRGLVSPTERRLTLALFVQLLPFPLILLLARAGIAAGYQFPYYLLVLPSAVVLAARGLLNLFSGRLLLLTLLLAQLTFQAAELRMALHQQKHFDETPQALREWVKDDDLTTENKKSSRDLERVLMLIAPPLFADDDKRALDPNYLALWQHRPGISTCTFYQPENFPFEYVDYRFGQPYQCAGLVLYSFTEVYASTLPSLLRHHRLLGQPVDIVLYDVESSPEYIRKLEQLLETLPHECRPIGTTWLCRVEA